MFGEVMLSELAQWWWLGVLVMGLLLGSFGGAVAYRIPRDLPLGLFKARRSQCTQCGIQIPWWNNIPVFTFIRLKGRTACCEKAMSWHYLVLELSMPFFFLFTTWLYMTHTPLFESPWMWWAELGKLWLFVFALLVTTTIDMEFRIIPDRFSWGGWAVALVACVLWGEPSLWNGILGGLLGFGLFFGMALFYEKVRKIEGLGMGDVKMMGWLGTWLGLSSLPTLILIASISGMIVGVVAMIKSKQGMQTAIPFGPFLAFAAYVQWVLNTLGVQPLEF